MTRTPFSAGIARLALLLLLFGVLSRCSRFGRQRGGGRSHVERRAGHHHRQSLGGTHHDYNHWESIDI
jgi:hypothetical protein